MIHEEPVKSCLQALRGIILRYDDSITETWKYAMPCFCINGTMFCYLRKEKKSGQLSIGFVEGKVLHHQKLEKGNRARIKVLYIDPFENIPIDLLNDLFKPALFKRICGESHT